MMRSDRRRTFSRTIALPSEFQTSMIASISSFCSAFKVAMPAKTFSNLRSAGSSGSFKTGAREAIAPSAKRSTTASSNACLEAK